jgi:hypothetical protein
MNIAASQHLTYFLLQPFKQIILQTRFLCIKENVVGKITEGVDPKVIFLLNIARR